MTDKSIKKLKEHLKRDGRTLKWFHETYFKRRKLSYNALMLQLNGYVMLSKAAQIIITKYLKTN